MGTAWKVGIAALFTLAMLVFAVGQTNLVDETGITASSGSYTNLTINDRSQVTTAATTKTVCSSGCDYDMTQLQDALNDIPRSLEHYYDIHINECGNFTANYTIPYYVANIASPTQTENVALDVYGNSSDFGCVRINSILSNGCGGGMCQSLSYFTMFGHSDRDDENAAINIYGKGTVTLGSIRFDNSSGDGNLHDGINCYDADLYVADIDFRDRQVSTGFKSKYNCRIHHVNNDINGTVSDKLFMMRGGFAQWNSALGNGTGDTADVDTANGAFVIDVANNKVYGMSRPQGSEWLVQSNAPVLGTLDSVAGNSYIKMLSTIDGVHNYTWTQTSSSMYLTDTANTGSLRISFNEDGTTELNASRFTLHSGDLNVSGNDVYATTFYGDGGSLTGITAADIGSGTFPTGDFTFQENVKVGGNDYFGIAVGQRYIPDDSTAGGGTMSTYGNFVVSIDYNNNSANGFFEVEKDGELGEGTSLFKVKEDGNITLYSPDSTAWNCGVSNAGTFSCS